MEKKSHFCRKKVTFFKNFKKFLRVYNVKIEISKKKVIFFRVKKWPIKKSSFFQGNSPCDFPKNEKTAKMTIFTFALTEENGLFWISKKNSAILSVQNRHRYFSNAKIIVISQVLLPWKRQKCQKYAKKVVKKGVQKGVFLAVFENTSKTLLFRVTHITGAIALEKAKKWQKKTQNWPLFYHFLGPWKMSKITFFCDFGPDSRKIIIFGRVLLSVHFWNAFERKWPSINPQITPLKMSKNRPTMSMIKKKVPKMDDFSHFFFGFLSKMSGFEQNP